MVEEGQSVAFVLSYGASYHGPPTAIDPFESLEVPRRSGGHGAIGVPTSGRGLKLSNARSLRLKR